LFAKKRNPSSGAASAARIAQSLRVGARNAARGFGRVPVIVVELFWIEDDDIVIDLFRLRSVHGMKRKQTISPAAKG
jgi:hypothetical protein